MPLTDNAYGLMDIQSTLLAMTREIDGVCRERGIPYSLLGGTMLGAARHKGFIPWDDDVDLVFTREALERFKIAFESNEDYVVNTTDTWVTRVLPRRAINGEFPFIDLFHYDAMPRGAFARRVKLLALKLLQGMLKEDTDYSGFGPLNRALLYITHVLGLLFPKSAKLRWYDRVCGMGARDGGSQLHISDEAFGCLGLTYDRKCAESFHDTPFEDATLMMSDEADAMLRLQYGDYMTPPPESARRTRHDTQRKHRS